MSGDLCIRCGQPATIHDWLHCEPCWQDICDEVHMAETDDRGCDPDAIGELMEREGIGFVEAVERLARERGLL